MCYAFQAQKFYRECIKLQGARVKVQLKPQAVRDLQGIQKRDADRIAARLQELESGLSGDIKRLTNFTPEYRLRVGNYRVLFEVSESTMTVYRIMHRRHVYTKR